MSGYSCPDCGCQHLGGTDRETDGRPVLHCHICEWEGTFEGGWREELTIDGYEECSRKYKLRKEGRLFFVRIHFNVLVFRLFARPAFKPFRFFSVQILIFNVDTGNH